jgi:hypothetical protein
VDIVPFLWRVLVKEISGHPCVYPAARKSKRQIKYFHHREAAPGILNVRKAKVCDASEHAVIHLDRVEKRAPGMVCNLYLTICTLLHLVAKPSTEERHRVSDGKVIGGLQLDDLCPAHKGMDPENEKNYNQ